MQQVHYFVLGKMLKYEVDVFLFSVTGRNHNGTIVLGSKISQELPSI